MVVKMINGKNGVVKAVKIRSGKLFIELPIQHLYSLELPCDIQPKTGLNVKAKEFAPKRNAAICASENI